MITRRMHVNYANVTATLALIFAMSGGALAAQRYLLNSTKQINPRVLKALKGNEGPTGPNGKQGAAGKEGRPGKEGPPGKEGMKGKEGAPGASGATHVTFRQSAPTGIPANSTEFVSISCNPGEVATGGGGVNQDTTGVHLKQSFPTPHLAGDTPTGWTVSYENTTASAHTIYADVVCASP